MRKVHVSVLLNEVVDGLDSLQSGGLVVDCTVGGGGHSEALLLKYPSISIVGIDRDENALKIARERLEGYGARVRLFESRFHEIDSLLDNIGIDKVNAVFADLGMSSFQIDDEDRGFSFKSDSPLDMRMGLNQTSAQDVVNTYSEKDLARVIYEYGEERFSRRIARKIVEERPVGTTGRLVDIIIRSIPGPARKRWKDTVARVFQSIRIEVNEELFGLSRLLEVGKERLAPGGRMAVISFHSLEDRLVKHAFLEDGFRRMTKKPIVPSEEERSENPRSRSAKLRIAERL